MVIVPVSSYVEAERSALVLGPPEPGLPVPVLEQPVLGQPVLGPGLAET